MTSGNQVDTIKMLFTYGIAACVVVGGGLMLFISRADPGIGDVRVVVAGFIGSALTFVFGSEVQTRTARQSAASTYAANVSNGVAAANEQEAAGQPPHHLT